jgi:hypothetical protein
MDKNPMRFLLPRRLGLVKVKMGDNEHLSTLSTHLHQDYASMQMPAATPTFTFEGLENHPDPESYRRDMASVGLMVSSSGVVTVGTMEQFADHILAAVGLDKPEKPEAKGEGHAPSSSPKAFQDAVMRGTTGKASAEPFPYLAEEPAPVCPHRSPNKRSFSEAQAEVSGHVVFEFNEDFTDVEITDFELKPVAKESAAPAPPAWRNPVLHVGDDESDKDATFLL